VYSGMTIRSEATQFFLLPLDPVRGFDKIREDLDILGELDPKLREARHRIDRHLRELTFEQDVLASVLWLQIRDHVRSQSNLRAVRRLLGDGDAVLRAVERGLETMFTRETVQEVGREVAQLDLADSPASKLLRDSRDEITLQQTRIVKLLIVSDIILVLLVVAVSEQVLAGG